MCMILFLLKKHIFEVYKNGPIFSTVLICDMCMNECMGLKYTKMYTNIKL